MGNMRVNFASRLIRLLWGGLYVATVSASFSSTHSFEAQKSLRVAAYDDEWGLHAARNLSAWRSHLFVATEKYIVSKGNTDKPRDWDRFHLFQPFISCPPGRPLRRVGPEGDGGKWLCEPAALKEPCIVISMGSNMDFRFEEAILNETRCKVATLDCTVEGKKLSDRHSFHKLCVGSAAAAQRDPAFVTYSQFISVLGEHKIDVLKIDVESFEFPLFGEWREHTRSLPDQIAVEVHWHEMYMRNFEADLQSHWGRGEFGVTDLALFFFHLANLGYGIVSQEINVLCGMCSEFTLVRVEASVPYGGMDPVYSGWHST